MHAAQRSTDRGGTELQGPAAAGAGAVRSGRSGRKRHRLLRGALWIAGIAATLAGAVWLAFTLSPWPASMLLRVVFEKDNVFVDTQLAQYLTPGATEARLDLHYDEADDDAYLDLYLPSGHGPGAQPLATVVWAHGGGWVSGSRDQFGSYARLIAEQGYAVAMIEYSTAPEVEYPAPPRQLLAALGYLSTNAQQLGIDPGRFVLGGDSAGAQIAAQVAAVVTGPAYAERAGLEPSIGPEQLRGIVLFCGPLDAAAIADIQSPDNPFATLMDVMLWAYTGTKDYAELMEVAAPTGNITADFPATFISVGGGDGLAKQSYAFAADLEAHGVPVDSLFYPEDHPTSLPHEYQFRFWEYPEAEQAFQRQLAFLKSVTAQ